MGVSVDGLEDEGERVYPKPVSEEWKRRTADSPLRPNRLSQRSTLTTSFHRLVSCENRVNNRPLLPKTASEVGRREGGQAMVRSRARIR